MLRKDFWTYEIISIKFLPRGKHEITFVYMFYISSLIESNQNSPKLRLSQKILDFGALFIRETVKTKQNKTTKKTYVILPTCYHSCYLSSRSSLSTDAPHSICRRSWAWSFLPSKCGECVSLLLDVYAILCFHVLASLRFYLCNSWLTLIKTVGDEKNLSSTLLGLYLGLAN